MPPCKNDPSSTYKGDEPSPKGLGYCAHAEKVGKTMKGKDGNMWIISETAKKIKRWVKVSQKVPGKHYYIHDNGGRPFLVVVNGKDVSIYKREKYDAQEKAPYNVLIKKIKAKAVIIGSDKSMKSKGVGNSILLDMGKNKYICITGLIFQFELENGDRFVKYFSQIGNSDVPYPVVLGENYFYSMVDLNCGSRKYFPENYKVNDYEDGHSFYYTSFEKKNKKKLKGFKIIEKRFFG